MRNETEMSLNDAVIQQMNDLCVVVHARRSLTSSLEEEGHEETDV